MRSTTIRSLATVILTLSISAAAVASPSSASSGKSFMLYGKVLSVDLKAKTLTVADSYSDKIFLVKVPEGASIKITFGINSRYSEPQLRDVNRNDRVIARCKLTPREHLALLDDGRQAIVVTAN